MATLKRHKISNLRALGTTILVTEMEFGERLTSGGIIMPTDDTKSQGIRPRWAKVYAVGKEQKDVKVNEYILVKHGRWTRGIDININGKDETIRKVDNADILLISDVKHNDDTGTTADITHSDRHRIEGSLHADNRQTDY